MTKEDYFAMADALGQEAGVLGGVHGYFKIHRTRLWQTATHFDIWNIQGKKVLEIGSFFSYTPFVFQKNSNEVTVVEAPDPVTEALQPLYAARGIRLVWADLLESFGDVNGTKHRLPFKDGEFDFIQCWETMEHFNFNPVGFVKDLHRLLKPGGQAALTVPNAARLSNRLKMVIGRPSMPTIESYYQFYDYAKRFVGWHWREYYLAEFVDLFQRSGFKILQASHLAIFQDREAGALRGPTLLGARLVSKVIPSCGNLCALRVSKK